MAVYSVKIGHGWTAGALTAMTPQPHSTGLQRTRRSIAADSSVYEEAPYILLEWNVLASSNAYGTLLNQFGLVSGLTCLVTVLVPNNFFAYSLYNGTAVQPEMGTDAKWSNFFLRDITILVRDLVAL